MFSNVAIAAMPETVQIIEMDLHIDPFEFCDHAFHERLRRRDCTESLTDLYIGSDGAHVDDSEKIYDFVAGHRTLRIEDQFQSLIQSGKIDIEAARGAGIGDRTIKRLTRLLGTA
jgi:hypothetical protein